MIVSIGTLYRVNDEDLEPGIAAPIGDQLMHGTVGDLVQQAINCDDGQTWRYSIVAGDGSILTAYQIVIVAQALGIRPI
ncbi:hypothetical protein WBP06_04060 [Novosphingobium sp. BL-8H]|uniref:hypothetical protein n=1 Tax=Novosphingobium sp. BL-8H TaxID=3127640 RepID=UPI00375676A0